ncbi:PRC-barrel domain-containing protein [Aestuariibius sp. 2305UL40-4]|uniref:PRC-barrel domain-containing protein n=1 Tax=Aestuariibius violaceus TaxID=3234132 RepID=UPI00345E2861
MRLHVMTAAALLLGGAAFAQDATGEVAPTEPTEGTTEMSDGMVAPEPETPLLVDENQLASRGVQYTAPSVQLEGFSTADAAAIPAEQLDGARVYSTDESSVGEIGELLVDTEGNLAAAVIEVGGFLGFGEKPVGVEISELQIMQSAEGGSLRVYIDATEDQLQELPDYQIQ